MTSLVDAVVLAKQFRHGYRTGMAIEILSGVVTIMRGMGWKLEELIASTIVGYEGRVMKQDWKKECIVMYTNSEQGLKYPSGSSRIESV